MMENFQGLELFHYVTIIYVTSVTKPFYYVWNTYSTRI